MTWGRCSARSCAPTSSPQGRSSRRSPAELAAQLISVAVVGSVGSQSELADRLGINRTVVTYLLDDLESAGLVSRQASRTDRRHRHIVATDGGRRVYEALGRARRRGEGEVLAALEPEQQVAVRTLLCRVASHAEEKMGSCGAFTKPSQEIPAVPGHARGQSNSQDLWTMIV